MKDKRGKETEFIGIQDQPIVFYNVWAININVKDETECSFFVCLSLINAINDYRKQNKLRPNGPLGLFADLTVRTFILPYYFV